MYRSCEQHRMLTDFEGVTRKNEVGFCVWTSKEFHQYQVVGRKLPTASIEHPKIYRMKLWATNEVRAKSKFWYFLRKLKKVKKSNGQVLAINEMFGFGGKCEGGCVRGIPLKSPVDLET
ncbi:PREDICTED: 60S ribosomal protein L18a-like isoform X3 [Prunus mume]|uniref:60S ribosomal protein L18a-like isoform X3 n=1 Tax=Prunus mume TaxID=102107 RepID=A0ABM1LUQ9_PRUMU|nr:PREDICTED: 60S ribosomal protein L18a-like isoform X3 [Prunus mume]